MNSQLESAIRLHQAGRIAEARQVYLQLHAQAPRNPVVLNLLGLAARQCGQFAEAVEFLQNAIAFDCSDAAYFANLAEAHRGLGQTAEAISNYREAARLQPREFLVQFNLAVLLHADDQDAEALTCYERALELNPQYARAHFGLGKLLGKGQRFAEAVASLERGLASEPNHVDALVQLGAAAEECQDSPLAISAYAWAVECAPENSPARLRLATALYLAKRHREAANHYRLLLDAPVERSEALRMLGLIALVVGDRAQAESSFDQALAEAPDDAEVRFIRAAMKLAAGNFLEGWPEMEWRAKRPGQVPREFGRRRWDGRPVPGGAILTYGEAGLGDILQFIRFAPLLAASSQAAQVWIEVAPQVAPLLRQSGFKNLLDFGKRPAEFDFEVPLMSLPALLKTTLDTVPAEIPYLHADSQRVARWRQRLGAVGGFKVGIHWQGSPLYTGDEHRSIPLAMFAPLARVPGVQLISLQKGHGLEQVSELREALGLITFDDLDAGEGAFLDTAALLQSLDLVITSDSAVAHLAGGMGVLTWLALSTFSDWRWLLEREDTPWYPTLRLWRQRQLDDWPEVFGRVAHALAAEVSGRT